MQRACSAGRLYALAQLLRAGGGHFASNMFQNHFCLFAEKVQQHLFPFALYNPITPEIKPLKSHRFCRSCFRSFLVCHRTASKSQSPKKALKVQAESS